jgi:hypothetical protein
MDALDGLIRLALKLSVWALVFFLPVATLVIVVLYGLVRHLIGLLRKLFHSKKTNTKYQSVASPADPETPPSVS